MIGNTHFDAMFHFKNEILKKVLNFSPKVCCNHEYQCQKWKQSLQRKTQLFCNLSHSCYRGKLVTTLLRLILPPSLSDGPL